MRLALLTFHLLLFAVVAKAQQYYSLVGKVDVCYDTSYKEILSKSSINLKLHSSDTGKEYSAVADNTGNFKFQGLPAGSYKLKAATLGFPDNDTSIIVEAPIRDLTFCIDKAYRPATTDSVTNYRERAKQDIKDGKIKIYDWTAWSVTKDPFKKINSKLKKKYEFEYEMKSCVRPVTRQEIEQVKLWEAYNEVIYQHLTTIHGLNWRKTIKHERNRISSNEL
ncbi:carboxypeptidase-like regulatory domain-containing protein [Pontibacter pudoricolor]|uniref:carboxypeptidase-like regulatory domain-containing protein n=1 Tax=Pontibacter pudoricolor TaxID=2694930 RepID=UPI0013907334|nr:carboxypeptidase-like regulatory domain-containing protein [Pontibacter pudoricolor]